MEGLLQSYYLKTGYPSTKIPKNSNISTRVAIRGGHQGHVLSLHYRVRQKKVDP